MKKAVVALGIAAGLGAAAVVGASVYTGRAVTERLSQQMREVQKLLPSFEVVEEKVEHGLFSSSRQVTVKLGCFPTALPGLPGIPGLAAGTAGTSAPQPLQVSFRDEIHHGPFLGAAGFGAASIDTVFARSKADKTAKAGGSELVVHSVVSFDGTVHGKVLVPGAKVDQPDLGRFESKPIAATFEVELGDAKAPIPYSLEVPRIDVTSEAQGEQFVFKMSGIKAQGVMQPAANPSLWLRAFKGTSSIASMEFSGRTPSTDGSPPVPMKAVFDQASMNAESTLQNDLFSSESSMSFRAKINDFQVDKIQVKSAMRRLHAPTYQALMNRVMGTLLSCDADAQQLAFLKLFSELQAQLPELLLHDPEYALDNASVELGGKHASFSYSVGTKGITKSDLTPDASLPALLTQKAVVKAAVELQLGLIERGIKAVLAMAPDAQPAAGAQQPAAQQLPVAGIPGMPAGAEDPALMMMAFVETMVGQAVQAGYVIREGDLVKSSAAIANGELSVNGKPLALPSMDDLTNGAQFMGGP
ncbi:MAG: DUF945 family protein [Myxococcales bacterium]